MLGFGKPNLIRLYDLNDEDRLVSISLMDIGAKWKRVKYDEIICILLITIFLLFFFAQSLTVFLVLLAFELVIGVFALIKNYKERR